jgi:hypothetical protein
MYPNTKAISTVHNTKVGLSSCRGCVLYRLGAPGLTTRSRLLEGVKNLRTKGIDTIGREDNPETTVKRISRNLRDCTRVSTDFGMIHRKIKVAASLWPMLSKPEKNSLNPAVC